MPVFCLFTLGRHGNFTAGVTSEQPDLLCTAFALNIELFEYYHVCRIHCRQRAPVGNALSSSGTSQLGMLTYRRRQKVSIMII